MKQGTIRIEYLTWIKNLDQMLDQATDRSSYFNLANSAIREPIDILLGQIDQYRAGLEDRIRETNVWGQRRLIELIARRYQTQPESILHTTRASDAIFLVCQAILADGGYAIVESPVYEPLVAAPQFLGAELAFVERRAENGFELNLNDLENVMKKLPAGRAKLVILSNLHNPTGTRLPDEMLERISALAARYDFWVLVDEIYHDFVLREQKTAAKTGDRFISINSFSKVFGLTALRCGWIIASTDVIERIRPIYVIVQNDGTRLDEALSAIVFENAAAYESHWSEVISRNRPILERIVEPLIEDGFVSGDVPPTGCIYFPKLTRLADQNATKRFVEWLNSEYRVFVGQGGVCRAPGFIRIGFGGDTLELDEGLQRLNRAIRTWSNTSRPQ